MLTVQIDTKRTVERGTSATPLNRVYMPLHDFTAVLKSALKDPDCPNKDNVQNVADLLSLLESPPRGHTRITNFPSLHHRSRHG